MKKILKWTGIVLLVLLLVAVSAGFYLINKAENLMGRTYAVEPEHIDIPSDSANLAKGARLAIFCKDCHGENFEGKAFFQDPKIGVVYAPNLTKGKGSPTATYSDKDWIRSIRHGVRPNGQGLLIMPSLEYNAMGKSDITALLAYIKTLAPIDNEPVKTELSNFGKILLAMNAFGEVHHASKIDHSKEAGGSPAEAVTAEYGSYLADISGCRACHGEKLSGGKHPDPNSPPVPDISMKGKAAKWSATQFIETIRNGKTPEGKVLDKKYMPYNAFAGLSEDQLSALHLYLKSLN